MLLEIWLTTSIRTKKFKIHTDSGYILNCWLTNGFFFFFSLHVVEGSDKDNLHKIVELPFQASNIYQFYFSKDKEKKRKEITFHIQSAKRTSTSS